MEWLLGAALLYHALNGLRIVIMDFWPRMTRYHRQLWYANWVVFVVIGIPVHAPDHGAGLRARAARSDARHERVSARRTGRGQPQGSGCELAVWYLMRLTGLGLFVLVAGALPDPARPLRPGDPDGRLDRRRPLEQHRLAGLRLADAHARRCSTRSWACAIVVGDYTGGRRADGRCTMLLYLLAIVLFAMGTIVVVTLPDVVPA